MSKTYLASPAEVSTLVEAGHKLLLAGDETLLSQIPPGSWIGGTTANFITAEGGVTDQNRIMVTDITEDAASVRIKVYDEEDLLRLGADYPDNGFSVIIVPGLSAIHAAFARGVQSYDGVFNSPLVGWISGVYLPEVGLRTPKAFAGDGQARENQAVVMHVSLPSGKSAHLDIINLFKPGSGAAIEFETEGFEVTGACRVDGEAANLTEYISANGIDTKLPLVADFNGAMINVSIQSVDIETGSVCFYAPVFKGVTYRFAEPAPNYIHEFARQSEDRGESGTIFSCNCILNYEYADLEGKRTGDFVGPVTFGEIAYMLVNQTLAYLAVE